MTHPKILGVTGWKNAGKTETVARLIRAFSSRGFTVSSVKHAHHQFTIDQPGRDSDRHRQAGAKEVLLVGGARWALMHEGQGEDTAPIGDLLKLMTPCDLVIIEGYKHEAHPKLEVRRKGARNQAPLGPDITNVIAVTSDTPPERATKPGDKPHFHHDDIDRICDYIAAKLGLETAGGGP